MTNGYLRRTAITDGNTKTWTTSFWVKRNRVDSASQQEVLFCDPGTGANTLMGFSADDEVQFYQWNGSSYDFRKGTLNQQVGAGAWSHFVFSFDSSKGYCYIYVNGVLQSSYANNVDLSTNQDSFWNSKITMQIGRPNAYVGVQISDVFNVDGQCLTPNDFGYYKPGVGYISMGGSESSEFSPGRWRPKKPSVIKNTINNGGGFGENGFYIPMNDYSNIGADFHCDPNTIITLKGEDDPQPKNGAPTTSDAYVSQLRSDPYASNLVLAVPGITGGQGSGFGDYHADIKGSGTNKTITAVGNAGLAATASYYGSALSFDGTGDWFTIPANDSDFQMGSGDFTVECWVKPKVNGANGGLVGVWNNTDNRRSWLIYLNSNNHFNFGVSSNGTDTDLSTPSFGKGTITDQWFHVAGERHGTFTRLYVNGKVVGIKTDCGSTSAFSNTQDKLTIGTWNDTNQDNSLNGVIQDVRVYKGVAKYKGVTFDVSRPYEPVGLNTARVTADEMDNIFDSWQPLEWGAGQSGITGDNYAYANTRRGKEDFDDYWTSYPQILTPTGKWYFECRPNQTNSWGPSFGINDREWEFNFSYFRDGEVYTKSVPNPRGPFTATVTTGLPTWGVGDIMSCCMDYDNGAMWVAKNGSWIDAGGSDSSATVKAEIEAGTRTSAIFTWEPSEVGAGTTNGDPVFQTRQRNGVSDWNWGQNPSFAGTISTVGTFTDDNGRGLFFFEPPSGFLSRCGDNMPASLTNFPNSGDNFKPIVYTGCGNTSRSITGIGFTPDLIWLKNRTGTSSWNMFDSVRGAPYVLFSDDATNEQVTDTRLLSFTPDGFVLGNNNAVNTDGGKFVAYCWKAGAGSTSLNTTGQTDSVTSVNTEYGFSIVNWAGDGQVRTVGHGLGQKPGLMIIKERNGSGQFYVYHKSFGASMNWKLNSNAGVTTSTGAGSWLDGTEPTSTVFTVGSNVNTNGVGKDMIAYLWAPKEGYSRMGTYFGSGNTNPFLVNCGFKPALVIIKKHESEAWFVADSARSPDNPSVTRLRLNSTAVEDNDESKYAIDFVPSGFVFNTADTQFNEANKRYLFIAFAEAPQLLTNAK